MSRQRIISIGRRFGSGGHEIAEILAKRLSLPLYDANILAEVAKKNDMTYEELMHYDEQRIPAFLSRPVRSFSSFLEVNVAEAQFHAIRQHAEAGESFVIVGRCADAVLDSYPGLISLFITADESSRTARTAGLYHISEKKAAAMNRKVDARRRSYHDYFCERKWGHADTYDLVLKENTVGIEHTAELIERYIAFRDAVEQN